MQENSIAMCKFRISKLYWKSLKMMVKIKRNLWNKFASFEAQVTSYKINKKKYEKEKERASWKLTIGRKKKLEAELTQLRATELMWKPVLSEIWVERVWDGLGFLLWLAFPARCVHWYVSGSQTSCLLEFIQAWNPKDCSYKILMGFVCFFSLSFFFPSFLWGLFWVK